MDFRPAAIYFWTDDFLMYAPAGTAQAATPWGAVQRAAWNVLTDR
jgi:hypothetical protein